MSRKLRPKTSRAYLLRAAYSASMVTGLSSGVFNAQLQQNLVRWPFLISAPEDVCLFAKESGPNLNCFATVAMLYGGVSHSLQTHLQVIQRGACAAGRGTC